MNKTPKNLICSSPLVLIQFVIMAIFVVTATMEAQTQFHIAGTIIYSITLAGLFSLTIFSLFQTFSTNPGEVTQ